MSAALLKLFEVKPLSELKFESTLEQLKDCISEKSLEPESLKPVTYSPNDIIVVGKYYDKKKLTAPVRTDSNKEQHKEKVYRKGPCAKFYILNQSTLDKDDAVWHYKNGKQIIGPTSCYNMDKMIYLKTINSQTRVAYKTLDKFVRLQKILKVVEDNYKEEQNSEEDD